MRKIIFTTLILGFVGCSSSPFKEATERNEHIRNHMAQGVQYAGGDFPERFSKSGKSGYYVTAIGKAVYDINSNTTTVEEAAIAAAKFRLVESGPSEFKTIIQKEIGNHLGVEGNFHKIDTSVVEVKKLIGIKVLNEDIVCKTRTEPTADGDYKNERECRAIARVKVRDLMSAYDFTVTDKYKVDKKKIIKLVIGKK